VPVGLVADNGFGRDAADDEEDALVVVVGLLPP
jgi:hypothetical protein